jgi:hypothetical protein
MIEKDIDSNIDSTPNEDFPQTATDYFILFFYNS